ncbi:hypothetical protein AC578_6655 [Pseudocercospora eumusae]|uniref:Uncharacterized protein n=1 Tax=Pseudocercospora eumusae TaxID=321146 RepID=A0A139HFT8_9PEZI|nr:hypothetical protein AC578_6655 [Pseudocercospora eumusae]
MGGDIATQIDLGFVGLYTTVSLILAYCNIKCLQMHRNRAWMLRAWVVAGLIITQRIVQIGRLDWYLRYNAKDYKILEELGSSILLITYPLPENVPAGVQAKIVFSLGEFAFPRWEQWVAKLSLEVSSAVSGSGGQGFAGGSFNGISTGMQKVITPATIQARSDMQREYDILDGKR